METNSTRSVGAVPPQREPPQKHDEQDREFAAPDEVEASGADETVAFNSSLPISAGRFELPTEIFHALLEEAQAFSLKNP